MLRIPAPLLCALLFVVVSVAGCVQQTPPESGLAAEDTTDPDPRPMVTLSTRDDRTPPRGDEGTDEGTDEEAFRPEQEPEPQTAPSEEPGPSSSPQPRPTPSEEQPTPSGPPEQTPSQEPEETPSQEPEETPSQEPEPADPPAPSPEPGPAAQWPQEGSFVKYRTTSDGGSPDGMYRTHKTNDIRLTYTDGTWSGSCETQTSERYQEYDDESGDYVTAWNNTTSTSTVAFEPPRAATDVTFGDTLDIPVVLGCADEVMEDLTILDRADHSAPRQSDGSPSWYAEWEPEWPAYKYAYWDTESGFLLAWRDQRHYSYLDGWMVDTDAPLP